MSQEPESSPRNVVNSVTGEVAGSVLQAGAIHGDIHLHQRSMVEWPYRFGIVPPRAASFQYREATQRVAQAVDEGNTAVLTSDGPGSTSVLSGLGGVGKTQLAVDYAEGLWAAGEVDLLVWITAGSRDAVVSSYSRLAGDLTGVDDTGPEQGMQRLLSWLASSQKRWLVVLDDVHSPSDLRELWPPTTPHGRVVVTTRRRDAALRGHRRRMIDIDVFTAAEAQRYLRDALADRPQLCVGSGGLAAELGFLPLALAQAVAYMIDRNLSCAAYRARLADRLRRLAALLPEVEGLPDEHRATVAATWSLSVERANRLKPAGLAGVLLEVASLLDANGIPTTVFTAPPILALLGDTTGRDVTAEEAWDGLGCLHRLSLITMNLDSTQRAVRVHALVQRATRDTLPDERLGVVARTAADALAEAWPEIERDTVLGQVLRANTDALSTVSGEHLWHLNGHPHGYRVLFRRGRSLGDSGSFAQAADYFHRLHATAAQHPGPDNPDTLTARHSSASWLGEAGDPAPAVIAYEELLTDRLRVLGADHPHTLLTRLNLARWRGEAGDSAGAAAALEELLTDQLRVLGPDHPYTLTTRSNLAYWLGEAGDPAAAAGASEKLLTDRLRVLGPDHPSTLLTRHNLASWRGKDGDPAAAAAASEKLLTDQLRVLGPDHPDTLLTRHNLARWHGETGDPAVAAAALEKVLTDQLRVLGPDHPHTLTTSSSLAYWRKQLSGGGRTDIARP